MKIPLIWYLYIIETRCKKWYTGITTARFNVHSNGKGAKYLKGKGLFQKIMGSRSIEYRVKQADSRTTLIFKFNELKN